MNSEDSNTLEDYFDVFWEKYFQESNEIPEDGRKLVHYTKFDTAKKIIRNNEIWFRNAIWMEDKKEITYGYDNMWEVFNSNDNKCLMSKLEDIYEGIGNEIKNWVKDRKNRENDRKNLVHQTFMFSLTLHEPSEHNLGRHSMWKTYGDVAIVLNNKFNLQQDIRGMSGSKVSYYRVDDFKTTINKFTEFVYDYSDALKKFQKDGRKGIIDLMKRMISYTAVYTKRPEYHKEKEWRCLINMSDNEHNHMKREIENLAEILQPVWKFKLNAIGGIENILDQIIIGSIEESYIKREVVIHLLKKANVKGAENMVKISDILSAKN